MEKFKALEPLKLYSSSPSTASPIRQRPAAPQLVGRLPSDLHLLILSYLPVPDFATYARCSHATAALAESESIWERRWKSLKMDKELSAVLDDLEEHARGRAAESRAAAPPTISVDDEFGDFASVDVPPDEMGDFVGAFQNPTTPISAAVWTNNSKSTTTSRAHYIRAHNLLKPLTRILSSPPHIILNDLAAAVTPSLRLEASTLRLLSLFLSPIIQPIRKWRECKASLRSAMDRFDANLLAAFDQADGKGDENGMREAAVSSWLVWDGSGDWEMGKVWAEKREIFYDQPWDPLANFTKDRGLAFDAMDEFMTLVLEAISEHGSRAVRVFPPEAGVLISFSDRVALDIVGEYITSVLTRAREISVDIFLKATAASFREAWKMVDTIMAAGGASTSRTRAEDVVYRMFETNMDEYLDEETEAVKPAFDETCKGWNRQSSERQNADSTARFLTSQNPSQVKRNVLASFADVLLLPVTIVPKTVTVVGGAIVSGGTAVGGAAAQGIAMLNPQRWGGAGGAGWGSSNAHSGYRKHGTDATETMFEIGPDEDEEEENEKFSSYDEKRPDVTPLPSAPLSASTLQNANTSLDQMNQMDTLLSLDVALELIHTCRESLKRLETFTGYPDRIGDRVRDTIEEVFILLLQALGDGHVKGGFSRATDRMTSYKPAEHEETTSVAPLLQFFELVHIGDTIQSMVQVYFDKEMAPHIDKNDFLNSVVREKKRFENSLDDSVAGGLNAGTEVLMNQVEHIIWKLTGPREYYPPDNAEMELKPTKGCTEAIKCLEMHCKLLKGSTSKEVLEVFHQEVGIRLIAILQKHIKRQIISLTGGFQVISDLNAYHSFITTLKVPSITADFAHLKMLGHVYVVEDAKDLAQIVRDVTRYGGAYRPEDIYEFIQRRSDWKKIEKTVDKTMYNLSFKEDCIVC